MEKGFDVLSNNTKNARSFVLELLIKMENNSAYSNILLDEKLSKSAFSHQDKKFASALFYGVIERKITLDEVIKKYSNKHISTLSVPVRQILRMGIYQLLYMDSVPESAAVNESVNLAKTNKNPAISGFVNGLLRSFLRDNLQIPTGRNFAENLSFQYSCPVWLVEKWLAEYGKNVAVSMLETSVGRAPITVKVNNLLTNDDELIGKLAQEDVVAVKSKFADNALEIVSGSSFIQSEAHKKGLFHVQDLSSQLTCLALEPSAGETVLDICSAPGGKTFTIAELMDNEGEIFAFDLHEKRVKLVLTGCKRLGISCIKGSANNGKIFNEQIPKADKILCDVPCSGLGVIRRKPEIKYKNPDDFAGLPEIQYEILSTSAKYLKVGGELIYSTCTLSRAENDEVIDRFLAENPNFEGVKIFPERGKPFGDFKVTITPEAFNSDGFFLAKIRKISD